MMKKWHKIFKDGAVSVSSPEDMRQLGKRIGELLEQGEILGIVGNLGAGKTHLTQGIVLGAGGSEDVSSPTFSLVHEHAGTRVSVCHFDFYRLKSSAELYGIGWDEYMDGVRVLVVEWADMFPEVMPADTEWILIEHVDERTRKVTLHQA